VASWFGATHAVKGAARKENAQWAFLAQSQLAGEAGQNPVLTDRIGAQRKSPIPLKSNKRDRQISRGHRRYDSVSSGRQTCGSRANWPTRDARQRRTCRRTERYAVSYC